MRSNLIRRMVIYIFAIFWALFAAEMFLRIFEPQAMLPRYVQAGDFGIRVNMPNQSYTHKTPDYTVKIHTNAQGIRAEHNLPYDKPEGKKRIVVLGDSFGMGYGVNIEDSFTEQMRKNLELATGEIFEIINLSVSGYGTAEQLLMLQHEGIKYHPDLVLVTWHATDPDDNVRSGLFEMKNGKLVRKNQAYLPGVKVREFLFSYKAYRWLAENSHLYNWLRRKAALKLKRWMVSFNKKAHSKNKEMELLTKNEAVDDMLSLALLEQIKMESEQVDAKLLILEIPSRRSKSEFAKSVPDNIRKKFDVVNPISEFSTYTGSLLYWERSHGHFTPLGCRIVGQLLSNEISSHDYTFLYR